MSEYVSINTSIPDIISAGNNLVFKGGDLQSAMAPLVANITSCEGAQVWGNDEFSGKFLKNYHGDDVKDVASESIKGLSSGSNSLGATSQNIGNNVITSMFGYSDTDTAGSADIDNTEV